MQFAQLIYFTNISIVVVHYIDNLFQVNKILSVIPRERNTYLYSATMTKKVVKTVINLLYYTVQFSVK